MIQQWIPICNKTSSDPPPPHLTWDFKFYNFLFLIFFLFYIVCRMQVRLTHLNRLSSADTLHACDRYVLMHVIRTHVCSTYAVSQYDVNTPHTFKRRTYAVCRSASYIRKMWTNKYFICIFDNLASVTSAMAKWAEELQS
jgi:hypothetical protein